MPLEDRDIFAAVFARYSDQPLEFVMAQYEKAKRLNAEIEKRIGVDAFTNELDVTMATSDLAAQAMAEEPKRKRYTRRSLKFNPDEAITNDGIVCCICGEKRTVLTARHLEGHGISKEDYMKLCGYPADQKLMSRKHARQMNENVKKAQLTRMQGRKPQEAADVKVRRNERA